MKGFKAKMLRGIQIYGTESIPTSNEHLLIMASCTKLSSPALQGGECLVSWSHDQATFRPRKGGKLVGTWSGSNSPQERTYESPTNKRVWDIKSTIMKVRIWSASYALKFRVVKNLIDACGNLLDTHDHVSWPNLVTKITLKASLDHNDNLIHQGSLLVSYFSAIHTLIRSGNHY